MYNSTTKNQFFKPKANKKWRPDKSHTIETCIEDTKSSLETEEQNNKKQINTKNTKTQKNTHKKSALFGPYFPHLSHLTCFIGFMSF